MLWFDGDSLKKIIPSNGKHDLKSRTERYKKMIQIAKFAYDQKINVSLFYLDSFDLNWRAPEESSQHHLKELVSIKKILQKDTLVVVDDSPITGYLQESNVKKGNLDFVPIGLVPKPTISGKGSLVHQYAMHTGAKLLFSNYQTGWIGFN